MHTTGLETAQELQQTPVIVGNSSQANRMRQFAKKVAGTTHNVLLRGETGVGKDLFAEFVHHNADALDGAFIPVNCGSLTETLFESELFGYRKGAFTGATEERRGLVEAAENGTLFFDEIGNMSLALQAKFLRLVEGRSFHSVGSTKEKMVKTRIITATNANLEDMVRQNQFRADLFHRMNVIPFAIPPLRERMCDLDDLITFFLSQQKSVIRKRFARSALAILSRYSWPGNVRELENVVKRATFLSSDYDEVIGAEHVEPFLKGVGGKNEHEDTQLTQPFFSGGELPTLYQLEKEYFTKLLEMNRGHISKSALMAGISRDILRKRIEQFGLGKLVHSLKKPKE